MRYLYVGLAGGLAAIARYSASVAVGVRGFPYATLAVNVSGAFLYGLLVPLVASGRIPRDLGTALTVGFLGAYTTFAAFGWETFSLIRTHRVGVAAIYIAASVCFGAGAAGAGWLVSRAVAH
jgi:CrcB protein